MPHGGMCLLRIVVMIALRIVVMIARALAVIQPGGRTRPGGTRDRVARKNLKVRGSAMSVTIDAKPQPMPEPPLPKAEPCVVVIFGASGDLTKRMLVPALARLWQAESLPTSFASTCAREYSGLAAMGTA